MVHSRRGYSNERRASSNTNKEDRRSSISSNRRSPNFYKCKLCNKFHSLKVCPKFLKMTPKQRNILVLREVYCVNCLARSHRFRDCRSENMCRKCGRPHNTLLHPNYQQRKSKSATNNTNEQRSNNAITSRTNTNGSQETSPNQKILSEAIRALASVLCSSSE
ncbi:uncharacterized protein LOC142233040 [Haematobia irritans]|uniref:uncharacterized protein LOC142222277 n=1 Tax=Haematobia irritans TaxID=7368 RepID=UPI003F5001B7